MDEKEYFYKNDFKQQNLTTKNSEIWKKNFPKICVNTNI